MPANPLKDLERQVNIDNVFGVPIEADGVTRTQVNSIDALRSELGRYGISQKNKFQLNISPPKNISPGGANTLRRLSIRCNAVTLPGNILETQSDSNIYGPNRDIVSGIGFSDDISARFILDDRFDIRRYFADWQKLAYSEYSWNIKYYKDYTGELDIFVLDKSFIPRAGYKIWEVYPKTIGPVEFDMSSTEGIQDFSVQFAFRYWTDIGEHASRQPNKTAELLELEEELFFDTE
jgi:hypothetical protein|tara:strand:+ start:5987 stop:6691 length:705 start_codon:yes stop_codon:yes gene_type:complete